VYEPIIIFTLSAMVLVSLAGIYAILHRPALAAPPPPEPEPFPFSYRDAYRPPGRWEPVEEDPQELQTVTRKDFDDLRALTTSLSHIVRALHDELYERNETKPKVKKGKRKAAQKTVRKPAASRK
jgi:hypothetical protein